MDDGTQTFTCKIPKFYIDPKTNQKIINPRWENEASVILAENTHVLKVFIQQGDNLKVFPFIVDKITDRRDSHFSVFKEVEANGLAFSDLGKVGYKLELNSHTLESDYEKDKTVVATIDYWLDKVFPNTKDSNGNIISWNTPWCYEIKMDWSYFSSERDSAKVYENSYTGSWIYDPNISPTELIPDGTVEGKEKARYIDCVNSNKYNITQTIAETFEVFCRYEYACESNGKFIKEYTDENGKVWTGKKVVFYNKAIKTENPLVIDYQKNLDTITRTADSTDIYTKLFVVPVESVAMNDGYVTIASTQANPILDDFILNFDYLDSVGSISEYQKQFINEYKIQMRLINQELISLGEDIEVSTVDLNTLEAQSAFIEAQRSSLNEQLDYYQGLRDNEVIKTPVTRGKNNSYSVVFVKDNVTGNLTASFHGLEGIDSDTIKGYKDFTYEEEKLLFSSVKVASSISEVTENNVVYALLGEDGFPASLAAKDGGIISLGTVYIGLTYLPKNKYDKLVNSAQALSDQSAAELDDYKNEKTGKIVLAKAALEEKEQLYNDKLLEKAKLNEKLERILGPALREGNWQTDNYEDPKKGIVTITGNGYEIENNVEFIFDQEPFENEQKAYVLISGAPYGQDKHYFHYLKAEDFSFENNRLEDLTIRLRRDFTYTVQSTNEEFLKREFLRIVVPFKGQKIEKYVKLTSPLKMGDKVLLNYRGNTNNLYINGKLQNWYEGEIPNPNQVWDITQELAYHKEDGEIYETLEGSLGEYFLYYGSGFKPAFYNISGTNTPVLLIVGNGLLDIKDKTFDYEAYNFISYSFIGKPEVYDIGSLEGNLIKPNEESDILVYPRIHINAENVQYNSDLMTLKLTDAVKEEASIDAPQLKKFEDYMVLSRKGQAYITLKVTQNNTFEYILNGPYRLDYQISHANEMLYLDAIQVAKDNSHPRYSYELKLANLPHEFAHVGLSEMVYINDHAMGIHAATGYISEVEYDLDEPWNDDIVIQNYKTKFEDLFHTITAQSEAMRKNSPKYDIAASGFTPNGSIAGSVLQQSLNNTQVYLDYSGTGVQITPQDGIILTNTQPYLNGVYGQIKLQGGGIFISSSVDENGNRIWSSSITPLGINANLLTAGQINTENIRIYSGDNMAFQWNPEGIFAYKNIEGELNPNVYVKYSQHGLHYIDETLEWDDSNLVNGKQSLVSLGWDGLTLRNKEGQKTLFAEAETGNLMLSGTMQSFNYVPGFVGSGWQINQDGNAEFNNIKVRGTLSASVFEYDETTAVGGSIWVAPTIIITQDKTSKAVLYEKSSNNQLYFKIPTPFKTIPGEDKRSNILCGKEWKELQEIWFNGKIVNKTNKEEIYEIKKLNMKISSLSFDTQDDISNIPKDYLYLTLSQKLEENNYPFIFYNNDGSLVENAANNDLWSRILNNEFTGLGDWHLIFRGEENETEGILITAMEEGAPYIDIYDTNKQKDGDSIPKGAPKVRLGKLDGLKNIVGIGAGGENALFPNIEGYGLYADNVYLRGAIYATSGRIGSLSIDEVINKHLNIVPELGDRNNFIINISNPNYRPTIYPKLIINNSQLEETYPNEIKSITYRFQYRDTSKESSTWINFNQKHLEWKDNTRDYTFVNSTTQETILNCQYRVEFKITYMNNGTTETIYSAPYSYNAIENGEQGEDGESAVQYKLIANATSIIRDLVNPIAPKELTFTINKIEGGTITSLSSTSDFSLSGTIYKNNGNTQTVNISNFKLNISSYTDNTYKSLVIYLKQGTKTVDVLTLPFELGDDLRELGKIQDGQVIINDGKVYAEALAAGSVISGKISAGAIQTGAIAAGSTLYLLAGGDSNYNPPPNYDAKSWTPYSGASALKWSDTNGYATQLEKGFSNIWENKRYTSGVKISSEGVFIRGDDGVFEVNMANFKIDSGGNVTLTGKIYTSEGGKIGNWNIGQYSLTSGSGDSYVAISTYTGSQTDPYRIWAGNETAAAAPFSVTASGALKAHKGTIGGWSLGENLLYSGSSKTRVALSSAPIPDGENDTYRIWAGDTSAASAPFSVTARGVLKATSGKIGGWTIGTDRLYAGSGDNYVALNTSTTSNSEYAIWAGYSNPVNADFAVKKDGTVYLKKLIALGEPDDDGNRKETNVNLSNYPFWKLNYQVVKSSTNNSITLSGGTTINFIRADAEISVGGKSGYVYPIIDGEEFTDDYKAVLASTENNVEVNGFNNTDKTALIWFDILLGSADTVLRRDFVKADVSSIYNAVTISSASPGSFSWGQTGPGRYYTEIPFTVQLSNGATRNYTIPVTHTV